MYSIILCATENDIIKIFRDQISRDRSFVVIEESDALVGLAGRPIGANALLVSPGYIAKTPDFSAYRWAPNYLVVTEGKLPDPVGFTGKISGLLRLGRDNQRLPELLRLVIGGYSVFPNSLDGFGYTVNLGGEEIVFSPLEYRVIKKKRDKFSDERICRELELTPGLLGKIMADISRKLTCSPGNENVTNFRVLERKDLSFDRIVERQNDPSFVLLSDQIAA